MSPEEIKALKAQITLDQIEQFKAHPVWKLLQWSATHRAIHAKTERDRIEAPRDLERYYLGEQAAITALLNFPDDLVNDMKTPERNGK